MPLYPRLLATVLVLGFVLGCDESVSSKKPPVSQQSDEQSRMISYLKSRNLPMLRDVEPWPNKFAPGLKIITDHYEVLTTLLDPLMLSQVPGFVESAYRSYQKQLPQNIDSRYKLPLYLFATRKQWETFTEDFTGHLAPLYKKIKRGAYYLNGSCVAYHIGRNRTFSVIAHEGWHQFNSRHFRYRLPSWLDEGLAMMFEAPQSGNGIFTFDASRNLQRLGGLKLTLMNNKMIPLRELIALNPGEVVVVNDDAVNAFYSQSYALVRFLKEDQYGKRLAGFHRMLMGAAGGTWPMDESSRRIASDRNIPLTVGYNRAVGTGTFRYYISDDFEQIQQEYLRFCGKLVYHVRFAK